MIKYKLFLVYDFVPRWKTQTKFWFQNIRIIFKCGRVQNVETVREYLENKTHHSVHSLFCGWVQRHVQIPPTAITEYDGTMKKG